MKNGDRVFVSENLKILSLSSDMEGRMFLNSKLLLKFSFIKLKKRLLDLSEDSILPLAYVYIQTKA